MSIRSRSTLVMSSFLGIGMIMFCSTMTQAAAQSLESSQPLEAWYAGAWDAPQPQEIPQDVRIMQTIVRTALAEVEPPPLPEELAGDSATGVRLLSGAGGSARSLVLNRSGRNSFSVRGDVSGFYMRGYGYLFTVRWPVSSVGLYSDFLVAREGRVEAVQTDESASGTSAAWAAEYRERLTEALRNAIAGYGSTLRRAKAGESLTFVADFGGGDDATVTMTVQADALQGSNPEANRNAIQVSTGQSGMPPRLKTELEIMSQIIDAALGSGGSLSSLYVESWSSYVGGSSESQYVPGYGVIFRKNARMNTARTFGPSRAISLDEVVADSIGQAARESYREHLDTLRRKTVEILAVYGPTLTELDDDDWVGIYYDVGSAAALLSGGLDDYLVQARMRDIRQAAAQGDPEAWLEERVVTNEREE